MKDLIKLAKRLMYHVNKMFNNATIDNKYLPESLRIKIFLETIEVLNLPGVE